MALSPESLLPLLAAATAVAAEAQAVFADERVARAEALGLFPTQVAPDRELLAKAIAAADEVRAIEAQLSTEVWVAHILG